MTAIDIDGPVGPIRTLVVNGTDAAQTPVLFVHGNAMVGAAWLPLIGLLGGSRTAVAPDLRGHGRSVHRGPYGAEEYTDDLVAAVDALDVSAFHVVGGLFGGMTACVLAARLPGRVRSLTAVGSALHVEIDPDEAEAALRSMGVRPFHEWQIPQAFPPGADPALVQSVIDGASEGRDIETVVAATKAAFSADVTLAARAVACPALVVSGEHDPACTPAQGRALAAALRGTFVELPGVGHAPMLEGPEALARHLLAHLEAAEATVGRVEG